MINASLDVLWQWQVNKNAPLCRYKRTLARLPRICLSTSCPSIPLLGDIVRCNHPGRGKYHSATQATSSNPPAITQLPPPLYLLRAALIASITSQDGASSMATTTEMQAHARPDNQLQDKRPVCGQAIVPFYSRCPADTQGSCHLIGKYVAIS